MHSRLYYLRDFSVKILCALGLSVGGLGCNDEVAENLDTSVEVTQSAVNPYCPISEPVLSAGQPTGFERCINRPELEHRVQVLDCPDFVRRSAQCPNYDSFENKEYRCRTDSDCESNEYCNSEYCFCTPIGECKRDSDCGQYSEYMLCHCGEALGECVYKGCVTDADCEPPFFCTGQKYSGCSGEFHCQLPLDACISDADCPNSQPDSHVVGCLRGRSTGAVCDVCAVAGRPFLVDGDVRTATVQHFDTAWLLDTLKPNVECLSDQDRKAHCERWIDIGLMEHASIAAFARSTMQLMSVGAPADLINKTIQAMMDETKHARWAFTLASAYAGHAVAPGVISVDNVLAHADFETLLETTILEGCIGETVAAIDAREDADNTTDPCVRNVLLQIAEDEMQHAILAWKTVQWALNIRPDLKEFFWSVLRTAVDTNDTANPLRTQTLRYVVIPCAQSVLSKDQGQQDGSDGVLVVAGTA